jgi:hypothetical protein
MDCGQTNRLELDPFTQEWYCQKCWEAFEEDEDAPKKLQAVKLLQDSKPKPKPAPQQKKQKAARPMLHAVLEEARPVPKAAVEVQQQIPHSAMLSRVVNCKKISFCSGKDFFHWFLSCSLSTSVCSHG